MGIVEVPRIMKATQVEVMAITALAIIIPMETIRKATAQTMVIQVEILTMEVLLFHANAQLIQKKENVVKGRLQKVVSTVGNTNKNKLN